MSTNDECTTDEQIAEFRAALKRGGGSVPMFNAGMAATDALAFERDRADQAKRFATEWKALAIAQVEKAERALLAAEDALYGEDNPYRGVGE